MIDELLFRLCPGSSTITLPVSGFPVSAAVALGTGTPTGGFGEPWRCPGEVVTDGDVEGLACAIGLDVGIRVGVGAGVTVGSAGTGEIAERVADCGEDDAIALAEEAAAEEASAEEAAADA